MTLIPAGRITWLPGLVLLVVLGACSDENSTQVLGASPVNTASNPSDVRDNIVQTASAAGTFNQLASLLVATGLDSVLADETRQFTVFAPNDEAFAKLSQATVDALAADRDALSDLLLYHVLADTVADGVAATSLAGGTTEAANGDNLAFSVDGSDLFINTSRVTATDIRASNGIIHVIDTVLMPPVDPDPDSQFANIVETAIQAGSFGTLVTALQATGLDSVLADESQMFTVFAPTDDAFAALGGASLDALLENTEELSNILLYHVLSGQAVDAITALTLAGTSVETANGDTIGLSIRDNSLFINDSSVTTTDIRTSNGIIHVIDAVLMPPADDPAPGPDPQPVTSTIFEVAESAGFSTFVAAVQVAGMDGALDHPDDIYTVFVPTNEAFAALGQDKIDALLADPATLREIVRLHILSGVVIDAARATSLLGYDIQAANGDIVQFSQQGDDLFIQDAKIIKADMAAVNGVIHVIDKVLLP